MLSNDSQTFFFLERKTVSLLLDIIRDTDFRNRRSMQAFCNKITNSWILIYPGFLHITTHRSNIKVPYCMWKSGPICLCYLSTECPTTVFCCLNILTIPKKKKKNCASSNRITAAILHNSTFNTFLYLESKSFYAKGCLNYSARALQLLYLVKKKVTKQLLYLLTAHLQLI